MISHLVALALVVSLQAAPQQGDEAQESEAKAEAEAKPEKICRYIREDMNSRRKKKVCMTKDQWQEFNQGN